MSKIKGLAGAVLGSSIALNGCGALIIGAAIHEHGRMQAQAIQNANDGGAYWSGKPTLFLDDVSYLNRGSAQPGSFSVYNDGVQYIGEGYVSIPNKSIRDMSIGGKMGELFGPTRNSFIIQTYDGGNFVFLFKEGYNLNALESLIEQGTKK